MHSLKIILFNENPICNHESSQKETLTELLEKVRLHTGIKAPTNTNVKVRTFQPPPSSHLDTTKATTKKINHRRNN